MYLSPEVSLSWCKVLSISCTFLSLVSTVVLVFPASSNCFLHLMEFSFLMRVTKKENFWRGATAYRTLTGSCTSPGYSSERTGDTEGLWPLQSNSKPVSKPFDSSSRPALMLRLLLTSARMLSWFRLLLTVCWFYESSCLDVLCPPPGFRNRKAPPPRFTEDVVLPHPDSA